MAGFGHFCPFIICMQKPVEMSCFTIQIICDRITPGETEYEWKKTEQVPIQLPNIARTLFDAKKIIKKNFLAWTSEIIQFIRFENHMDGPG